MTKNTEPRLRQYINEDEVYRKYMFGELKDPNDFEMYCIEHCEDIKTLLEKNEELEKELNEKPKIDNYEKKWAKLKVFVDDMLELIQFHIEDLAMDYGDTMFTDTLEARKAIFKEIKEKMEKLEGK